MGTRNIGTKKITARRKWYHINVPGFGVFFVKASNKDEARKLGFKKVVSIRSQIQYPGLDKVRMPELKVNRIGETIAREELLTRKQTTAYRQWKREHGKFGK